LNQLMIRLACKSLRQAGLVLACLMGTVCHGQEGYFGTAKVKINPLQPIMLSGYAGRASMPEATGMQLDIFAQAAAFGSGADTSLLLTVECTGLPDNVVDPLRAKLATNLGIAQERIVMTATHSHSCPCIEGYLPNLFGSPLPPSKQQHVDAYTAKLVEWMEGAAEEALDNRTPGHQISWANGSVGFGMNRRGEGVVDHDLPVMLVQNAMGEAEAIITSYATHAVTLNGGDNLVSGDWPGYARQALETMYPGATAMIMIGAGADSNPNATGSVSNAVAHGRTVANEVRRLIDNDLLTPVSQQISAFHDEIDLDYATSLVSGDPASAMLASSPSSSSYGVTSWTFGDDLAMVFMEGEVVADYSLRLKAELGDKVWVNGYSNDVQGYIPSERVLFAGGYEADSSNYYYANPGRYAHGLENKIVSAVHEQLLDFSGMGDRLRLLVDWGTGEMSIVNMGGETVAIDAYTIVSAAGSLNPSNSGWHSFQDQGLNGWDQADNSNSTRLTEFNPTGVRTFAPGSSASIGRPLLVAAPAKFGDEIESVGLTFEYSIAGVGAEEGLVRGLLTNAPVNNLVLTIDPDTGAASLRNASPFFDVSIAAYTIASASGKLQSGDGAWRSFADQSLVGWDEADNSNSFRITEFNIEDGALLAGEGPAMLLGNLLNANGDPIDLNDLHFEFLLATGETMEGVIEFASVGNGGDFDSDGDVDGADFLVWQRTLGSNVSSLGSGADGNANGVVDAGDLVIWKNGFRAGSSSLVSIAVPEPAAMTITVILLASVVSRKRLSTV
jgi:hypothetical protein